MIIYPATLLIGIPNEIAFDGERRLVTAVRLRHTIEQTVVENPPVLAQSHEPAKARIAS